MTTPTRLPSRVGEGGNGAGAPARQNTSAVPGSPNGKDSGCGGKPSCAGSVSHAGRGSRHGSHVVRGPVPRHSPMDRLRRSVAPAKDAGEYLLYAWDRLRQPMEGFTGWRGPVMKAWPRLHTFPRRFRRCAPLRQARRRVGPQDGVRSNLCASFRQLANARGEDAEAVPGPQRQSQSVVSRSSLRPMRLCK